MRIILLGILLISSILVNGQDTNYNLQSKYIAGGYDVVAYFDNNPTKGNSAHTITYDGAVFKFINANNLVTFKLNPDKYIPQYGGWCAYAMATEGKKVKIDPKTFEIRNDKLYLFYNAYFNNTFEDWLEEGPDELVKKADLNWQVIIKGDL